MTCVELQQSLVENENGNNPAQQAHLKNCPDCAALVGELLVIACAAGDLRAAHEPSPRVWKNIEFALRQEGIFRRPRGGYSLLPSQSGPWGWARWWALPVAAALLITIGVTVRQHPFGSLVTNNYSVPPVGPDVSEAKMVGLNDDDLLQEIAQQAPALKAAYTDNLRKVNEYIRDAKNGVDADPNDQEARRSLMEAYQEKAMLFDLAMDRSLP